jgi:Ca2+-binding EF-hand superfamily protein
MGRGPLKQYVLPNEILRELLKNTDFDGPEINCAYEKFMADCPHGKIGLERFKTVYQDIFPKGNPELYAENIFRCIDENGNNWIEFQEFISTMGILARGSLNKKLEWVFRVYDKDSSGSISKAELSAIIKSLYKMYGSEIMKADFKMDVKELTESIFSQMDLNGDGKVTLDEFIKATNSHEMIKKILEIDPHSYL